MKLALCTPTHQGLSNNTKSVARDAMVWEISTWYEKTNKTIKLPSFINRPKEHVLLAKCELITQLNFPFKTIFII